MFNRLEQYFLEPINTVTHLFGAIGAFGGLLLLVYLTRTEPGKMLSLVVYGLCMTLLFTASTLLHGAKLTDKNRMRLNRLDHAAIFLMIVGTYTPIIYNFFPEKWLWPTLIGYWLIAVGGILYKTFSKKIHGVINKTIYPVLSWGGVVPAFFASQQHLLIPKGGMALLLLGGLIYMVGFIIYYRQRPDPWPNLFGHHEIWHLFVLAGSFCHFLFMLFYIVPA
ncbi:MAG: hemolysin III family protein [Candidatus Promineifilaceae bacterium]